MPSNLHHSKGSAGRKDRHGFIIVPVLWILGALSAAISIYSVFVIDTAAGLRAHDYRLRSDASVSAAIELTAYRRLAGGAGSRSRPGQFSFRLNGANINVDYRSEAARIDLNAAPKELIAGLFFALGERSAAAELYANRIVQWRSDERRQDSETGAALPNRFASGLRRSKLPHTSELFLVPDLPSALVERALPFLTVYGGPQINLFEAAPRVIAALPEISPERVEAILKVRQASSDNGLLALVQSSQKYITFVGNNALRVVVRVTFDNGQRASAEAVILVFEEGDTPYSILTRRDDLDQSSIPPNTGASLQ